MSCLRTFYVFILANVVMIYLMINTGALFMLVMIIFVPFIIWAIKKAPQELERFSEYRRQKEEAKRKKE